MSGLERADTKSISLKSEDILCLSVVRNETLRLPFFLDYYRERGVSHFLMVDNNSDDGTLDYLLAQPDTFVWHTRDSFKNKLSWLKELLARYGRDRWCLIVDADEIFYYPGCEIRMMNDLCGQLERQGKNALQAIMLDMYAARPIREVKYRQGSDFLEACPYFDKKFYHHKEGLLNDYYWGGLRQRVFQDRASESTSESKKLYCLTKFPLIKYNSTMQLYSEHMVRNIKTSSTTGCLLHFKYLASFVDYVKQEVRRDEHWQGAVEYKKYARLLEEEGNLNLYDAHFSIALKNSQQLVEMGIMRRGNSDFLNEAIYDAKVRGMAVAKILFQKLRRHQTEHLG
ncbi:MAG: glycosyltransferase family 2 protein [Cyanobacteriota bacterium]|nr:glycosyltransferase family 2 protein [Cyanobacteriota bacterium]